MTKRLAQTKLDFAPAPKRQCIDLTKPRSMRKKKKKENDSELRSIDKVLSPKLTKEEIRALRQSRTLGTNEKNKHPLDGIITTDFTYDKHDYYVDGLKIDKSIGWYSVSGWLHMYWKKFQAELISRGQATSTVSKGGMSLHPECKTIEEKIKKETALVREAWDKTRNNGSDRHSAFDAFLQGRDMSEEEENTIPEGFYKFLLDHPRLDVYRTEMSLVDRNSKLTGQPDGIMIDLDTDELEVYDWKNTGKEDDDDLGKQNAPHGYHILTYDMVDSKLNHYKMQLSMYHSIYKRFYLEYTGLKLSNMATIVNYNPSDPSGYKLYRFEVLDMTPFLELMPWNRLDTRHNDSSFWLTRLSSTIPLHAQPLPLVPMREEELEGDIEGGPHDFERENDYTRAQESDGKIRTRYRRYRTGTQLFPGWVWIEGPYPGKKVREEKPHLPVMPDSIFRHPIHWYGKPPVSEYAIYERHLLSTETLLSQVHTLFGKTLVGWGYENNPYSYARVLMKYADHSRGKPLITLCISPFTDSAAAPKKDLRTLGGSNKIPKKLPLLSAPAEADKPVCLTCLKRPPSTTCIPCGHVYACVQCIVDSQPSICAICRADLMSVIRWPYKS